MDRTRNLFQRLEHLFDEEERALAMSDLASIKEINVRKSHLLLELNRAGRQLEGLPIEPGLAKAAARLRERLETHRNLLARHVTALGELTTLITRAIQHEDSDGTYTARSIRHAHRP